MVDKITVIPRSIRAYGNVLLEDRSITEYEGYKSALFENVAIINGETLRVFHEVYSEYTVGFNFNPGTKELYVSTDDDTVITDFSFDDVNKELDFESTIFSFDYDTDLKELYVTDDVSPTVLFEDDCSSADGLSNYGAIRPISSSTTTSQLEYNSTQNAYYVHADGDWGIIPITALNGEDNYTITAEIKTKDSYSTYQGGIGFIAPAGTNNIIFRKYNTNCNSALNAGTQEESIGTIRLANEQWHKFEITKQGQTYTITVTDMGNNTVIGTQTRTVTFDTYYVGFMVVAGSNYGSYVRNIKAEAL